ncbi:MAG: tetratricopeptide repeat protein [Ruminococcaceae bacterium]|nr:tetratricopeptide repeat protein [Oscillospiraceae bacterium]
MINGYISAELIRSKLDEYFYKKDYDSAERHLLYWLSNSEEANDIRTEIMVRNELMGLYRKLGKRNEAISAARAAMQKVYAVRSTYKIDTATTYLNSATVFKAFGMPDEALPLFEKAKYIYESTLPENDSRLGGLYNNMGLILVDLKRFKEANELYKKAVEVMQKAKKGSLEVAITYLNMASAAEAEIGLENADVIITEYLKKAEALLDGYPSRDGYYAFVCEKCASVFGYYGWFLFEKELNERARRFYQNEGS